MGKTIKDTMEFEESELKSLFGPSKGTLKPSKAVQSVRTVQRPLLVSKASTQALCAELAKRSYRFVVKYRTEILCVAVAIEFILLILRG